MKKNETDVKRIYDNQTKTWFEVSPEQYEEFDRWRTNLRKREQYHHRCMCPRSKWWLCDGMCQDCEFHAPGDTLSLDMPISNEDGDTCSPLDSVPDTAPLMADVVADKLLLEQLIQRLRELDPEADLILQMLGEEKSDRSIAEELGRPQRTFARQMQLYRNELRKVRGY